MEVCRLDDVHLTDVSGIARMFSEEEFEGLKPPSCKQNVEKNSNKKNCTLLFTL